MEQLSHAGHEFSIDDEFKVLKEFAHIEPRVQIKIESIEDLGDGMYDITFKTNGVGPDEVQVPVGKVTAALEHDKITRIN